MAIAIRVKQLSKTFTVKETSPGLFGALKGLFYTRRYPFQAIKGISFEIETGERVAFIGPNGAGKSTTIKILTGILYPTSGEVHVLGLVPWQNRQKLGYQIGTVFGQRTQLWYQLPASDTFALLAKIYELDETSYQQRLKELIKVFELGPFLDKPVRQLSLGERMRCEIVASLIHRPQILFLDEPTIGLDINAKLMIRDLLNRLSYEQGTTLFLTSHDTADIEKVCERVIILDKGQIIKDSSIKELRRTALKKKVVSLLVADEHFSLTIPGVRILRRDKHHVVCEVDLAITSIDYVMQEAFKRTSIKDVTIEDPSMEEIIREIYGASA